MIKIRKPKDFWAGFFFMAFGLVAIWIARDYPMGTALRMGAGYFPTALGGVLAVVGLVVSVRAFWGESEPFPQLAWRPLLMILISVVLFGLLIERLGLVLTTVVLVLVSRLAGIKFRWLESLALAGLLAVVCAALFVYGLSLLFPLWPWFMMKD